MAEGILIFDYEIRKIISCFAPSLNEIIHVEVPYKLLSAVRIIIVTKEVSLRHFP